MLPPAWAVTGPGALPQAVQELCWLCWALTLLLGLFQLLDGTDFEHVTGSVLRVLQFHLYSKSLVLRRMAVSSFVKLSGRPKKVSRGSWAQ